VILGYLNAKILGIAPLSKPKQSHT